MLWHASARIKYNLFMDEGEMPRTCKQASISLNQAGSLADTKRHEGLKIKWKFLRPPGVQELFLEPQAFQTLDP